MLYASPPAEPEAAAISPLVYSLYFLLLPRTSSDGYLLAFFCSLRAAALGHVQVKLERVTVHWKIGYAFGTRRCIIGVCLIFVAFVSSPPGRCGRNSWGRRREA